MMKYDNSDLEHLSEAKSNAAQVLEDSGRKLNQTTPRLSVQQSKHTINYLNTCTD